MMDEKTDKELLDGMRGGDNTAMKAFYELYAPSFNTICYRYVVDRDDAKDVLQEAFVKIFQSIHQFQYRGEGSLRAWSSRIVVNECLKFLRNKSYLPTQPIEEYSNMAIEEPEMDDIPMSIILEMIQKLPDGYRMVFNLFVFEQKSHKEIATILGIAENSSASQYHRAKKTLAKEVEQYRLKQR